VAACGEADRGSAQTLGARAGRLAFRVAWAQQDVFQFVHLNDITAIESVAYLIKYDSVHGEPEAGGRKDDRVV
jgi:glyceraldehyde-3-phosphate dehydrogenase/erythrose-4-phosphate dehydrogenase